jgi:hypothetical protein
VTESIQIALSVNAVVLVPPTGVQLIRRDLIVAIHLRASEAP